ncbi:MAG: hypothetical protein GY758_12755 [Fuerstiella sp.]|nr:hypothetical protein [Fuerstiella sp.]MCP4507781.1 hypothetical protein [Fuerstiella sp.]MDG2126429.1 hypothetical protein [Fuerstiella sp.]
MTRTFSQCLSDSVADPRILRLLHVDFDSIDYGKAIFIGSDVADRRGIPGRVPYLYLVIEGGPGTEHEAAVVTFQGVTLVPVGRSGGWAAQL